MISQGPIVCFGEVLVRLTAPDSELLLQSGRLNVNFGGAETNVAVSLSRLGSPSRMVSVLPDNAIGHAAFDELRRHGVDVSGLRFTAGRMGLYFLTPGAVLRPSDVIYDRWGSVFAEAAPDAVDWRAMLQGASALHMSGITPALGPKAAEAALRAAKAAVALGVPVSFDGNYRGKLWTLWNGDGPKILRELLACATLAFVDDRDIALVLGQTFGAAVPVERCRQAAKAAFAAFPNLQRIATTSRAQESIHRHEFSAVSFARDGREWASEAQTLTGIVDRIGAGDAFAAGFLHGLRRGFDDQASLDFAKAAACLKHGIPGDFNLASEADVKALLEQEGLDVRR
jgi:2-dehydro-3-deoxygluconokinase